MYTVYVHVEPSRSGPFVTSYTLCVQAKLQGQRDAIVPSPTVVAHTTTPEHRTPAHYAYKERVVYVWFGADIMASVALKSSVWRESVFHAVFY